MTLFKQLRQWHDNLPAHVRRTVVYPLLGSLAALLFLITAFSTTILAAVVAGPLIAFALLVFWCVLGLWSLVAVANEYLDL